VWWWRARRIHSEERGINYSIEYVTPRNTRITTTIRSMREIERREAARISRIWRNGNHQRGRAISPRLTSDVDFLLGGAHPGDGAEGAERARSGESLNYRVAKAEATASLSGQGQETIPRRGECVRI